MEDRFTQIYAQKKALGTESIEIWLDQATGVQYLFRQSGYSGGLTPLLGRDGKPLLIDEQPFPV